MTSKPDNSFGSEASNRRLRKRHAAEWRLKVYGILALTLAGTALAVLMWSVVGKAGAALSETYITLSVDLDPAILDPDGARDPKKLLRADFAGLTKKTLRAAFKDVKNRKDKKALYDLVSGGAAFELAQKVAADPALVGTTLDFSFLASDVADLYQKGAYGTLSAQPVSGTLEIDRKGRKIILSSSAPDFQPLMAGIHAHFRRMAARADVQAGMQNAGQAEFLRRAAAATNPEVKAANQKLAAERLAKRDGFRTKAAALRARANDPAALVKLDRQTNSVLIKANGGWIKLTKLAPERAEGVVLAPVDAPRARTTDWRLVYSDVPEKARQFSDKQIVWMETLAAKGRVKTVFNTRFFTAGDSREPELAGLWGAVAGSALTMLVTLVLAFPVGVMAAIYLEEFAPKNKFTALVEVNINNLAAVPSIVFGLLGLAVFIGFFGVPRSAPLAGGIVLAIMTLPTVIISSRASIAAVPPSIRDAALGIGASKVQMAFHHVLPLSLPGIMTGAIIGMARALGETAPLIMIGMVAFIVDIPNGVTDSATVLPVQIFRWADLPERAFQSRTSLAILVLLVFLILMNGLAVFLRRRFERRW